MHEEESLEDDWPLEKTQLRNNTSVTLPRFQCLEVMLRFLDEGVQSAGEKINLTFNHSQVLHSFIQAYHKSHTTFIHTSSAKVTLWVSLPLGASFTFSLMSTVSISSSESSFEG